MTIFQKIAWLLIGCLTLGCAAGAIAYHLTLIPFVSCIIGIFMVVVPWGTLTHLFIRCPSCNQYPIARGALTRCQYCGCDLTILHDNKLNKKD